MPDRATSAAKMRALLKGDKPILRMSVADPMTARMAQHAGFDSLVVGGYMLGAQSCLTEPIIDMTQNWEASRKVQAAVDIPVSVDAGAGYGEAIQVWHTVRQMEAAGLAALQMEDQLFPKRAHYHRDFQENTIELGHMLEKLSAAFEARKDPDFCIFARTDTLKTHGYDEAIRRANAFLDAGADAIILFPNTMEELERAPKDVKGPLTTIVSHGNRVGRPVLSASELADMGYKIISYPITTGLVIYQSLMETYREITRTGRAELDHEEMVKVRLELEDTIGLPELYAIEERTTEKPGSAIHQNRQQAR
ncbi:oxaloacetate decarboxylase [Ensifer sp. YR511]|uniref:isocitrate lyase/PEP mutase family protein n=1 Tax=Ensifer sp. YR511 TaxID=1855294 RepID=UPI00088F634C|nr:isocitrate lyase/PEP mutase family protein [Ensifer sp. YR511]SDN73693.1 2-Methylisocitrate lyase, PEP mutase family [Ensifer sp. YR511]